MKNLDRYEKDLKRLLDHGRKLSMALRREHSKEQLDVQLKKVMKEKFDDYIKSLPSFSDDYQSWYSESLSVIKQLTPDRLLDFKRLYERPKVRKAITVDTYTIEDALYGLRTSRLGETIADQSAAFGLIDQQIAMLRGAQDRLKSSLFDIRQLVQAEVFDSEIVSARELHKRGFLRAAGAVSGVVLEKHLGQVVEDHGFQLGKANPTISDLNNKLK